MKFRFLASTLAWLGINSQSGNRSGISAHATMSVKERTNTLFSILVPSGEEQSRSATIRSLVRQTCTRWEAFICTANGLDNTPLAGSLEERRLQLLQTTTTDGVLEVLQAYVNGDWLIVLKPGSVLADDALHVVEQLLARRPEALAFYSDSALTDITGRVTGFCLHPAWSPDYFDAVPYPDGLVGIRASLIKQWSEHTTAHVEPWFFPFLREIGRTPGAICHVAEVLLLRPETQSLSWLGRESRAAFLSSLDRTDAGVVAEPDTLPGSLRVTHLLSVTPSVEIVIPTHNGGAMLRHCLESVFNKTDFPAFKVAIVDNRTTDPSALAFLADVAARPGVRLIRYDEPFNFSAINNLAVSTSDAEVICLLNDDVEVISPGWLTEMVSHAWRQEVGAVGARLLYPDGRVQHAGIVVGMRRSAAHGHKGAARQDDGYMGRLRVVQNCTAVTGACLVVSREKYLEVGGMDDQRLTVAYNDVDFCLKLRKAGYQNVWTPYAELLHHESATRGRDSSPAKRRRLKSEARLMEERWGMSTFQDPYYHPALTLKCEDFSVAEKPWPLSKRRRMICR